MEPGLASELIVLTPFDAFAELPQPLLAFTRIFPPFDDAVTEIVFFVEVPIQPLGSVHVYDVAPATGLIV
jgi:hypothetical protein